MNKLHALDVDSVLPGVNQAYTGLLSQEGRGLYTSRGRFFNHTIFGRDAAMSGKFVVDFDHETAVDVMRTLIAFQGTQYNHKTQEELGRIHHEWRDFRLWRGTVFEHVPFWLLHRKWDVRDRTLLTYFSLDTTAAFIRLVHKYATHIDAAILDKKARNRHGHETTIGAAVEAAAGWLMGMIGDEGLLSERRTNTWSLPVQTFQDSLYARRDGSLADVRGPIAYVEVQAYAADALYDMAHMLPHHDQAVAWRQTGLRMHQAMLGAFRQADGYLASAIDRRGQVDVANISAGWVLNTFIWHEVSDAERRAAIEPIVTRLFSADFLTPVGLRTRALSAPDPIAGAVDYHGSETVWPMFNFMVIEGLRRHRMYDLAEQLERRVINGLNAVGGFSEYHIVQRDGTVVLPTEKWLAPRLAVQMKQEKNIGFSIVPAMVMARRALAPSPRMNQKPWQAALEQQLLAGIEQVERAAPASAAGVIGPTRTMHLRRWTAGLRVVRYFWRQRRMV